MTGNGWGADNPAAGWCLGVDRPPHVVDELAPGDDDGRALCPACRIRWQQRGTRPSGRRGSDAGAPAGGG